MPYNSAEAIPHSLNIGCKLAEERGYHEINLNVGCPSDRVQNGMFGACLMAKADLVAECIAEMQNVVNIPVTVKTRIGIDDLIAMNFSATLSKKSIMQAAKNLLFTHEKPGFQD